MLKLLNVQLFVICTIFNPICTITLQVLFLTLYVIFFAFFNPSPLYLKSAILTLTIWNLVRIYTSTIGLEIHINKVWGSDYFADVSTFLQKLSIFSKITFMTSRENNYVLIINFGGIFQVSWSILVNCVISVLQKWRHSEKFSMMS